MSALNNSLLLGADAGGGGYAISRSLRFNSADSSFLSRTPASAGNRKTWTWSAWIKRNKLGTAQQFLTCSTSGYSTFSILGFNASDALIVYFQGGSNPNLQPAAVYRDCSAWMHVLISCDTTQATAANRGAVYINGSKVTTFTHETYPSQNADTDFNTAFAHDIGRQSTGNYYCDFMLADVHWIDGQALTPTSFGEFDDNGIWQPIAYTGTYGTNGFHLEFADNSSNTATTLGKDTSGNGNNWTPNNLSVVSSYSTVVSNIASAGTTWGNINNAFDGNTGTYADGTGNNGTVSTITFNKPLTGVTLLEYYWGGTSTYGYNTTNVGTGPSSSSPGYVTAYSGSAITINNLRAVSQPGDGVVRVYAIRVNGTVLTGYTEGNPAGNDSLVDVPVNGAQTDTGVGGEVRGNYCTLNPLDNGGVTLSNGNLDVTLGATRGVRSDFGVSSGKYYYEMTVGTFGPQGPAVGIAYANANISTNYAGSDANAWVYNGGDGKIYNNASGAGSNALYTTNDVIGVAINMDSGVVTFYKNGSAQPTTVTSLSSTVFAVVTTGGTAGIQYLNFGQRPFAYPVSGFKALCTANLPAPVVTKPSTVMDVKLYTGNGSTQTISGLGFSPDFVWYKSRVSTVFNHGLFDIVRGAQYFLASNSANGELGSISGVTAFNSDGFTVGNDAGVNTNGAAMVAWAWDAGSSTVTNTQGSITSSVRANATAGFSIVTYTGNGTSGATVGHGLNVAPQLLIVKRRSSAGSTANWAVWHGSLTAGQNLFLNTTDSASAYSPSRFTSTLPTSTVFSIGGGDETNYSGGTFVCYAFSPVSGYASMGSFVANGSSEGVFQWCGFRPRFLLLKCSSVSDAFQHWHIFDSARNTYNVMNARLQANSSAAEDSFSVIDFTSNGFKLRYADPYFNQSGATYIYYAVAESPFQYARAR